MIYSDIFLDMIGFTTFTGSHIFFCSVFSLDYPPLRLERFSAACQRHQVWLVVDNTYEHFTYEEAWTQQL